MKNIENKIKNMSDLVLKQALNMITFTCNIQRVQQYNKIHCLFTKEPPEHIFKL